MWGSRFWYPHTNTITDYIGQEMADGADMLRIVRTSRVGMGAGGGGMHMQQLVSCLSKPLELEVKARRQLQSGLQASDNRVRVGSSNQSVLSYCVKAFAKRQWHVRLNGHKFLRLCSCKESAERLRGLSRPVCLIGRAFSILMLWRAHGEGARI